LSKKLRETIDSNIKIRLVGGGVLHTRDIDKTERKNKVGKGMHKALKGTHNMIIKVTP
jgi:hypothetical protein